ncbi:MAG: hypothetical protein ACREDW_00725 [Aestuariivirgaceae bacterium]
MTPIAASAMTEVRSLHAAFEALFTGRGRDLGRCARALAADFSMVAPDGSRLDREAVLTSLAAAAASADFRISIRDLAPIWEAEDSVLLQYVEEQYRDGRTTRRLSTALFTAEAEAPCGVVWRYLQETWMQVAAPQQEK